MPMAPEKQAELLVRLKKVEGQVRGLYRMVEDGRECEDVVTQLSAVRAALDQIGFLFVTSHMRECMSKSGQDPKSQDESLEKLMKLFLKLA